MSAADLERFLASVEPLAVETVGDENVPLASFAALSTAISMKRIADALWGIDGTSGIIELLNGIEMNGRRAA
jgi:hypothetical protein